jgi:hypothetical protein
MAARVSKVASSVVEAGEWFFLDTVLASVHTHTVFWVARFLRPACLRWLRPPPSLASWGGGRCAALCASVCPQLPADMPTRDRTETQTETR